MDRITITEADILDALTQALGGAESEDGHTSAELAELTGWGKSKLREALRRGIQSGAWEAVPVVRTSVLNGITRPVPGYRPVRSSG